MNSLSAYLLVSHGSRDPRPQAALESLAQLVANRIQFDALGNPVSGREMPPANVDRWLEQISPGVSLTLQRFPVVGVASLELAILPLHQQIQEFGNYIATLGLRTVRILPLFLLPGVHVMEDIPAELELAQQRLAPDLTIEQVPFLGSHPDLKNLLQLELQEDPKQGLILLTHGSRRLEGNTTARTIAAQLQAEIAYWSSPDTLESCIQRLISTGHDRITILSYFLFPGSTTDAISQTVAELTDKFHPVELYLTPPIGATVALADLVVDLLKP